MLRINITAFVLLVFVGAAFGAFSTLRLRDKLHRRLLLENDVVGGPSAQWFEQELDHFNFQETRTWQQRYFVNDANFNSKAGGPVFLYIGGEGAISSRDVTSLTYNKWAVEVGAIVVALEHRYYGQSHPLPDLSTPNLQYLNSDQALADTANFLEWFLQQYPTAGPVVSFGGSYPGNLAAWFRLKYPHLTIGAVASSAPVLAVLNMDSYLEVVNDALTKYGGASCVQSIQLATNQIRSLLTTEAGQYKLKQLFGLCTVPSSPLDITNFMTELTENIMGVVQYNGISARSPDIPYICKIMVDASVGDNLARYVKVNKLFAPSGCLDITYSSMISQFQDVNAWGSSGVGMRQWIYQTCAEFGYYQTTDAKNQPFGDFMPLEFYLGICKDAFGLTYLPRINETNAKYGGRNFKGTNTIFVNGSVDPWHSLSILNTTDPNIDVVYIPGTSHCADMLPARISDPPALAAAQSQIGKIVKNWVK